MPQSRVDSGGGLHCAPGTEGQRRGFRGPLRGGPRRRPVRSQMDGEKTPAAPAWAAAMRPCRGSGAYWGGPRAGRARRRGRPAAAGKRYNERAGRGAVAFGRTHDIADLGEPLVGQQVGIGGWVEDVRGMARMTFLTVRDSTGRAQVVVKGGEGDAAAAAASIPRQSAVVARGTVQETRARGLSVEVAAESVDVLNRASPRLPIDPTGRLESGLDLRLDARALDMRGPRAPAVFRMRHHALAAIREHLSSARFTEITTPKIIGSASEGGANLFSLEYFGRTAYLAQSPQLYKEQMTMGLERVYEIANFYRAEKSHTGRHLTEFSSVDIEAAFMDYTDVMGVLEGTVAAACRRLAAKCGAEAEALGAAVPDPSMPFERVTYGQAVAELADAGEDIRHGDDLLDSHLRVLGGMHPGFFFLTDWPLALKPFYIRAKDDDPSLSRSFDLQHGYLELSSGGTRLHDPAAIEERLRAQGLDPAQFAGHLRTFEWGMPPHSGWGLGLDRLVAVLAGLDNVREAVLYPRDPDRLSP